jgi:hypothetical protein
MSALKVITVGAVMFILGVGAGYNGGAFHARAEIQASCDDVHQTKTYINGHSYSCADYDNVRAAIQGLINMIPGATIAPGAGPDDAAPQRPGTAI